MDEKTWRERGLTDDVLAELYRRGRKYASARITREHQEDAVQDGMCRVLVVASDPPSDYPEDPLKRLNYLTTVLCNEAMRLISRKLPPDCDIPTEE